MRWDPRTPSDEGHWLGGGIEPDGNTLDMFLSTPLRGGARVTRTEGRTLLRELASATTEGTSHVSALTAIASARGPGNVGDLCIEMAAKVSRGATLTEAMAAHPETFSGPAQALVRAGEQYGDVATGLLLAADALEDRDLAWNSRLRALVLHLATGWVATLGMTALSFLLRPVLANSAGGSLPGVTAALLDVARYLPALAAVASAASIVSVLFGTTLPGARLRLPRQLSPDLGRGALDRAATVIGWLLECGATAAEALRTAAAASEAEAGELVRAAELAADGQGLVSVLASTPALAPLAPLAAAAGASTGVVFRDQAAHLRRDAQESRPTTWPRDAAWQIAPLLVWLLWLVGVVVPVSTR